MFFFNLHKIIKITFTITVFFYEFLIMKFNLTNNAQILIKKLSFFLTYEINICEKKPKHACF